MAEPIQESIERIVSDVVDAAMQVHMALGPGLLESVYETCLCYELTKRGLRVARQIPVNVVYGEIVIEAGLRIDILVEDGVVIELKAVEEMIPLFEAQLLTYLKLSNKRLGFLINFNTTFLKHGLKRMVL